MRWTFDWLPWRPHLTAPFFLHFWAAAKGIFYLCRKTLPYMTRRFFLALSWLLPVLAIAQLKSPDAFLPHRLGEQFTPHHVLVSYFEHVAAHSPNVKLIPYGATAQGRPLIVAVVSAPENLARLEDIRLNHLRRAGMAEGRPDPGLDRVIVGLGFSVHGNEAAGSESSMGVIYELVNPANTHAQQWLRNTIVLLDPSLNPDGYSRYTHWYRDVSPRIPDPRPGAREHREPWPGGRVNHYLFDLNRDWAWQTQPESRQRVKFYHQWLPHVFADIHEQGPNEPYYFAPAAEPYHTYITDWQRRFQVAIGQNHARYFDREGWLYFTKERFDLLYPSYGDTYPTYMGSIGMTYEQGGIGAGRALLIENGDTLTLFDRVAHHQTAALSTVEVASRHADDLIKNFQAFFERSRQNPPGPYKAFVIRASNPPGRLKAFVELLDRNGIQYGRAGKKLSVKGFDYRKGAEADFAVEENDLLVSAYQPAGTLAQILLEPHTQLADSLTYDITAWALPYAYGLEACAVRQRLDPKFPFEILASQALLGQDKPYAYVAFRESLEDARFLADLLRQGVKARFASQAFRTEGRDYPAGAIVITRADNRHLTGTLDALIAKTAGQYRIRIYPVKTGMAEKGADFGSPSFPMVVQPRIAVLSGEGTYNNSYGQVWHFLEQELNLPFIALPANQLSSLDLSDYNTLILPEGNYSLDDAAASKLSQWANRGGRIIALGSALYAFQDRSGFALARYESPDAKSKAEKAQETTLLENRLQPYAEQDRQAASGDIPGAIFKVTIDTSHPLAFGLANDNVYFSLKTSTQAYPWLKNAWNVGTLNDSLTYYGFVGEQAKAAMKNTVVFAVEEKGRGAIVYMVDNPLFRGFWYQGKHLFCNALFFIGR